MKSMHCRTNANAVPGAIERSCRGELTAVVRWNKLGSARILPANGRSIQSGLLPTLFCLSVLALSGCGGRVVVTHSTGSLAATPATVAFGNVAVGQAAKATIS